MTSFAEYTKLNVQLIRTITVKSSVVCDKTNTYDNYRSPDSVLVDSPDTWRYYKNLAGEYHQLDKKMFVVSHDNLETILFDKDVLKEHPETKKAYYIGGEYWKSLTRSYPNQERLIYGILHPVDKNVATSAKEWDILSYDSSLVEEQETSLMRDLQDWIRIHQDRWDKKVYNNIESFYAGAQLGILFINLVPALMNIRLSKTGTNEAHSFHIEQFLSSHNDLGKFMGFLNLKQQLYLYRNIRYLERNAGKNSSLTELIKILLTERFIPLMEYTCKHTGSFDSEYRNNFMFRKKPLNTQYNIPAKDYFTLDEVLSKELTLTPGNEAYLEFNRDTIARKFATSNSSVIKTKDLESSMLDMTDSGPYPLTSVLMTEWFWCVKNDRYRAVVKFVNKYKASVNTLSAKDAMILATILAHRSNGEEITSIPSYSLSRVVRQPLIKRDELLASVSDSFLDSSDVADFILERLSPIPDLGSITSFYEHAYSVYKTHNVFWRLLSETGDLDDRTRIEKMVDAAYADVVFNISETGEDVSDWLAAKSIDISDLNNEQLGHLTTSLVETALGLNINQTPTLSNIQKAMIDILVKLSSYSIQVTREINTSPLSTMGWSAVRFTRPKSSVSLARLVEIRGDEYLSGGQSTEVLNSDVCETNIDLSETVSSSDIYSIVTENLASLDFNDTGDYLVSFNTSNTAVMASGSFLDNEHLDRESLSRLLELTRVINSNGKLTGPYSSSEYLDFTKPTLVTRPTNTEVMTGTDFRLE